jgi:hypothetical protein
MAGLELYAYMRRESSSVRFVFGTRSAGLEQAEFASGVEVLAKPYRLADLRRLVGTPFVSAMRTRR